jgi:hypothetical protein
MATEQGSPETEASDIFFEYQLASMLVCLVLTIAGVGDQ